MKNYVSKIDMQYNFNSGGKVEIFEFSVCYHTKQWDGLGEH